MTSGGSFGQGPLTQADLDDYRRRVNEKSPTPQDAMRFGDLSMQITARLNHEDMQVYDQSICLLKKSPAGSPEEREMAEFVIKSIEGRVLTANPEKVKDQRALKENIDGLSVRLLHEEPSKRGVVVSEDWKFYSRGGRVFTVQIDGESGTRTFDRLQLQLLCNVCKQDAAKRCSRCKHAAYCSADCQSAEWSAHRPNCKKA